MPFETPITIEKALDRIGQRHYVLPAIQREFVWNPAQICRLFDSLMRGYPIGSFLFWKVTGETFKKFVFYEVIRDYHEKTAPHCKKFEPYTPSDVTAILDGQQRLTALNIGLHGSHAEKLPKKWATSLDAYPTKRLYLDLCRVDDDSDELSLMYQFKFLTEEQAQKPEPGGHWFPVNRIFSFESGPDIFEYIQGNNLAHHKKAYRTLDRLNEVVKRWQSINFFEEEDQDLDKVLNIFIRVNSGGTQLSYSDLLLSIATAQWPQRDAREEVYGLVDELNGTGQAFSFSKDLVLKSGLILGEINDIRFGVANFNQANMAILDQAWDKIAFALRLATRLLDRFGFSGRTLGADSVLIPVAYYLCSRGADGSYLTGAAYENDRKAMQGWVIRSLLKQGIWGSGLDTLLSALRQKMRDTGTSSFRVDTLEAEMARLGKSLRFETEELEDLVTIPFSDRRVFAVLTLLYPGVDVANVFHVDHIFPQARFSKSRLLAAGVPEHKVAEFRDKYDRLQNLQLLEGGKNMEKQATLPLAWARSWYPDPGALDYYLAGHDMHDLPEVLSEFEVFYEARARRMVHRLAKTLGV